MSKDTLTPDGIINSFKILPLQTITGAATDQTGAILKAMNAALGDSQITDLTEGSVPDELQQLASQHPEVFQQISTEERLQLTWYRDLVAGYKVFTDLYSRVGGMYSAVDKNEVAKRLHASIGPNNNLIDLPTELARQSLTMLPQDQQIAQARLLGMVFAMDQLASDQEKKGKSQEELLLSDTATKAVLLLVPPNVTFREYVRSPDGSMVQATLNLLSEQSIGVLKTASSQSIIGQRDGNIAR